MKSSKRWSEQETAAAERTPRTREDTDRALAAWLFQPGHAIPVRSTGHHYSTIGAPGWDLLSRMILGERNPGMFRPGNQPASQQRRDQVQAAIDAGHPTVPVGAGKGAGGGYQALPIDCSGFASITRPDGTTGPWRDWITRTELGTELHMVRAACYIFIAALSMMRDSEIQEIGRDAIVSHYGSPAIRSRRIKHDRARSAHRWWITEPVAEAIQVLERLSCHPTHILGPMSAPARRQERDTGITAAYDIDLFIETVNGSAARLGLEPVPEGRIRPHMFRRILSA